MRGVSTVYLSHLSYWETASVSAVWGMILLSAATLCMLNFSSIAQVGLDLDIPQILMERMAFHFILRARANDLFCNLILSRNIVSPVT